MQTIFNPFVIRIRWLPSHASVWLSIVIVQNYAVCQAYYQAYSWKKFSLNCRSLHNAFPANFLDGISNCTSEVSSRLLSSWFLAHSCLWIFRHLGLNRRLLAFSLRFFLWFVFRADFHSAVKAFKLLSMNKKKLFNFSRFVFFFLTKIMNFNDIADGKARKWDVYVYFPFQLNSGIWTDHHYGR